MQNNGSTFALIVIIILIGLAIILLSFKRRTGTKSVTESHNLSKDENSLTAAERQKIEEYMDNKFQYYKWKFLIDYQLYYFKGLSLDPKVINSISKVEVQNIGKPIDEETFFKMEPLKEYLHRMITAYNSNLKIAANLGINEYLKLMDKALAIKAHIEVLELFKPYVQSKEETDKWNELFNSEPEPYLYQ